MKFYAILTVASTLIAGSLHAQHVNLGVKAGLNVYTINNNNEVDYQSKAGINLGLIGHIHLDKQLALQPEIVYSGQGAKYNTGNVETKLNLDYINVPVLLQYMFDNGFRLQAGPQVGFLIKAKSKAGAVSIDIKNNFRTVDFGIGAGVGYVHPESGFGVDARYNLGLSKINDNNSVKSYNRGFQLGVFYLFKNK